jgi:hypothetical protein
VLHVPFKYFKTGSVVIVPFQWLKPFPWVVRHVVARKHRPPIATEAIVSMFLAPPRLTSSTALPRLPTCHVSVGKNKHHISEDPSLIIYLANFKNIFAQAFYQ